VTNTAVSVSNGLFTTTIDFGGAFDGNPRWLEIWVKSNGANNFVMLTPRQQLTPTPYAITASAIINPLGSGVATTNYVYDIVTNLAGSFITNDNSVSLITNLTVHIFTNLVVNLLATNCCCCTNADTNVDWHVAGNIGTTAGLNFVGTIDNQPLELKAFNQRALRLEPNVGPAAPNVIGGSFSNVVDAGIIGATIGGGGASNYLGSYGPNQVSANFGTIAGGLQNNIGSDSDYAAIGGGLQNSISAANATIGGGTANTVSADSGTIGGGDGNTIQSYASDSTIGGGRANTISSGTAGATIAGGQGHTIGGYVDNSTIAGGEHDTIGNFDDDCAIGGGDSNVIEDSVSHGAIAGGLGNTIKSFANQAAIPGGFRNVAGGLDSFAAGNQANATNNGAFVWSDTSSFPFYSTNDNEFAVRAVGGVRFVSAVDLSGNPIAGVQLMSGGTSWATISDQNAKKNFAPVNGGDVLARLTAVPVEKWNYKWESDSATPNIGPMAQAFKAAFYPGRDDKSITTLEFDGVELAAIQGLNQKLSEKDAEIAELKARLAKLELLVLSKNGVGTFLPVPARNER
jgi:hypothetical protein